MRTPLIVVMLLSAVFVAAVAQEPQVQLDVRYDATSRVLEGVYELRYVPESETTYFTLLANLDAQANPYLSARAQDAVYPLGFEPSRISILSVERVAENGDTALPYRLLALPPAWQTYSLDETVLAVDVTPRVDGSSVTLRCRFITEIPRTTRGDGGITDGILTWRFGWFPTLLPESSQIVEQDGVIGYAARDTFPLVFPWTRLSATFSFPAELSLITGADSAETLPGDDEAVRTVAVDNATPSRSLAFTLGGSYERYRLEGTTTVEVFYLPTHERQARILATLALEIVADYSGRYGSYPRTSLTLVENPSSEGQAFAADGIVWLSSRFFTHQDVLFPGALSRVTEYVLAHEIAHQWVGLGTGIDLDAEAWLSEGLAQYLSVRYFENRYGASEPNLFGEQMPGVVREIVEQQWGFLNLREHFIELPYLQTLHAGFDEALIQPTEHVQFGNADTVRLYDKGYLVARALAAKIGTHAFERALTQAITDRRADLLDARDLQAALESTSGLSLTEFFDHWVFGAGTADYAVSILERAAENGVHTTRVLVTRDGGVAQDVDVQATMRSEGTVRLTWDGAESSAVLEFTTPSRVIEVTIDPDHVLPDVDRLNNHAPVRVIGAVSSNVFPLDAYVLAPDESTGGASFFHLDRLRVSVTQTTADASVKVGRAHQIAIHASFASPQLAGSLAYTFTGFDQPETGSAATVWQSAYTLTVAVERHADEDSFFTVALQATDLSSVSDMGTRSFQLRIAPRGAVQLGISLHEEWRLVPSVYLLFDGRVGGSSGDVPSSLQYAVSELRSIPIPHAPQMGAAKLSLELPGSGPLPYSLLHLAMLDDVRSRLFVTVGGGWTSLDEFGTTSVSVEAGMEQILELSTLGGLLSLTARVGIATPVVGDGATTLYGSISF